MSWHEYYERINGFFNTFKDNYILYILELLLLFGIFYFMLRVLKHNRAFIFIYVVVFGILLCGITFSIAKFEKGIFMLAILMIALVVFNMFHTEIKRMFFDSNSKKRRTVITVSGVEAIIDETVRAVQNMSKKDIGALIVLSNDNLPEGIIESGTVINADINAEMIEAVFYPKAPLHDGAMIIRGNKIYAAGCFLPLIQDENLPQEVGSRHRAAMGVTTVASVTAIVVSEETGIISIVKNGAIKKKYADAADLKNALSDYYWSDLTSEGKL